MIMNEIVYSILILIITILAGIPLIFAFGLATVYLVYMLNISPNMLVIAAYSNSISFALLAVPLFLIASELMVLGGVSDKLISVADALIGGKMKGHLGAVMILACTFFGAISGSNTATIAAIGGSMYPIMVKRGYPKEYVAALAASAGRMGELIPPSIPAILYGMVSGTSIAAVFLATIIPGLILATGFTIVNHFYCRNVATISQREQVGDQRSYLRNVAKSLWSSSLALFMPVIILGGIYGGAFTPTEAAVVSAVYAFIVGAFVYKRIDAKTFFGTTKHAALVTGSLLLLMAFTVMWNRVFVLEKAPERLLLWVTELTKDKTTLLIIVNVYLLIQGCFLGEAPGILLATPLLMPVINYCGVHPVHFGSILLINLGAGCMTPPVAPNLFIASYVTGLPIPQFLKPSMVFLILIMLPVIVMTTYIPELSLFLPRVILGIR
jgi:tripartite ATP-independent transporter DctM subunit